MRGCPLHRTPAQCAQCPGPQDSTMPARKKTLAMSGLKGREACFSICKKKFHEILRRHHGTFRIRTGTGKGHGDSRLCFYVPFELLGAQRADLPIWVRLSGPIRVSHGLYSVTAHCYIKNLFQPLFRVNSFFRILFFLQSSYCQ